MAFTSATITGYRSILAKAVEFATSKHVSAAVINAGGTGYTVGDILTIPHAGASLTATIEVTSVAAGVIDGIILRSMGAYSNRLASAVVNAGGSGYAVNDILQVQGGTFTQKAKARVATLSGSAVATVTVEEAGGAYSTAPGLTGAATLGVGPAAFAGNDACTLDLTMTGLIGTTGIAGTGGTGSGATFDLTLTDTGWSTVRDNHDYTFNSLTDEKEVILLGTVAGGDAPYVGLRSYTATVGPDTRYGWLLMGMDEFNDGLSFETQPNAGPNGTPSSDVGVCLLMFDDAQDCWFNSTGRWIITVIKAVGASITTYQTGFVGLMNPFGTATENPYPMYLSGSSSVHNRAPDAGGLLVTGPTELFAANTSTCPAFYRKASSGVWTRTQNSNNGAATKTDVMFPIGQINQANGAGTNEDNIGTENIDFFDGIALISGATATVLLMPTEGDDESRLFPATVVSVPNNTGNNDNETLIRGELPMIYWVSATKADGTVLAAEDTFEEAGVRYRAFQNAHRTERYSYFALRES